MVDHTSSTYCSVVLDSMVDGLSFPSTPLRLYGSRPPTFLHAGMRTCVLRVYESKP